MMDDRRASPASPARHRGSRFIGAAMSERFFFDLVCGEEVIRDDEGVEARDLDQALAEARSVIAEMAEEMTEASLGRPWVLIVRDNMGSIAGRLPVSG